MKCGDAIEPPKRPPPPLDEDLPGRLRGEAEGRRKLRVKLADERLEHESEAMEVLDPERARNKLDEWRSLASIAHSLIAANLRALEERLP